MTDVSNLSLCCVAARNENRKGRSLAANGCAGAAAGSESAVDVAFFTNSLDGTLMREECSGVEGLFVMHS